MLAWLLLPTLALAESYVPSEPELLLKKFRDAGRVITEQAPKPILLSCQYADSRGRTYKDVDPTKPGSISKTLTDKGPIPGVAPLTPPKGITPVPIGANGRALLEKLVPANGDAYRVVRQLQHHNREISGRLEEFYKAAQESAALTGPLPVGADEEFSCDKDLKPLLKELRRRSATHRRIASTTSGIFYRALDTEVNLLMQKPFVKEFYQSGKTYLNFGRCAEMEKTVRAIHDAMAEQRAALSGLVAYNEAKSKELADHAERFEGLISGCQTAK